jgi:hypothetical protein
MESRSTDIIRPNKNLNRDSIMSLILLPELEHTY